jgi:hypothetical protein
MFEKLIGEIQHRGQTIQVPVESDRLVPSIEVVDNKRVLFLEFEGTKYPCLDRGWTSWAGKILVPKGHERSADNGLADKETGRLKRWSISTVRKFLEMTPTDIADKTVKSWWERHDPDTWHLVKYADNGSLGPIRYIGTNRYRLYRHVDFLADLSSSDFTGMEIRNQSVTEDHMVLRVTDPEPLPIDGVNVFAGFHLLNSENGSSSIMIRHLIYDLICTNGLIMVFDKNTVIQQRHSKFDVPAFRERVAEASKELPAIHKESKELVIDLTQRTYDRREVDAILEMYRNHYDASKKFLEAVDGKIPGVRPSAWQVVSAITESAQGYGWRTRMDHEEQAGKLIRDIWKDKHLDFLVPDEEVKQETQEEARVS